MGKGKKKQQGKAKAEAKAKVKAQAKGKADAKPRAAETYEDAELTGKAARKSRRSKEKAAAARSEQEVARSWSDVLRVGPGFDLTALDPRSTPGFDGGKSDGEEVMGGLQARLSDLQERLFAESRGGGTRSVLLVIQGMDTAGKGGIMRHVVGAVDPQGVDITAFKAPTAEEKRHPFLWRIRNALPGPGMIGVFDRSHYEDVLVVRVHNLVEEPVWRERYEIINAFEAELAEAGTTALKCYLHISREEQRSRLLDRLDRPDKHWKYNPSDVDERTRWLDYQDAYSEALTRCSTDLAPWHVVPADRKWYRNWAISMILLETFASLGLRWPQTEVDLDHERARLAAS